MRFARCGGPRARPRAGHVVASQRHVETTTTTTFDLLTDFDLGLNMKMWCY